MSNKSNQYIFITKLMVQLTEEKTKKRDGDTGGWRPYLGWVLCWTSFFHCLRASLSCLCTSEICSRNFCLTALCCWKMSSVTLRDARSIRACRVLALSTMLHMQAHHMTCIQNQINIQYWHLVCIGWTFETYVALLFKKIKWQRNPFPLPFARTHTCTTPHFLIPPYPCGVTLVWYHYQCYY